MLSMVLVDAREVVPVGENALPGVTNDLRGADRERWETGVGRFAAARFEEVYPGVDWVFRGDAGAVAYDFIVAAGADAGQIRMRLEGVDSVALGAAGGLRASVGGERFDHSAPVIYQPTVAGLEYVDGGFVVDPIAGEVGFWIGDHDPDRELVIDPAIGFSSYLGGISSEDLPRIALAPDGSVVVVGTTASPDLPVGAGAAGSPPAAAEIAGDVDAFVAKLAPDGTKLDFVTYLGGRGADRAGGIVVADDGTIWISGQTTSDDLPAAGGALAGPADGFVLRLSADGTTVQMAAYIGGSGADSATGIDRDAGGYIYLTGTTTSSDFPVVAPAQGELGGPSDAFVVKLGPSGQETVYATYLGGGSSNDAGFAIAADAAGNAFVTGSTEATDFPLVAAVQPEFGGGSDAFVIKLTPAGAIAWATVLGGSGADVGLALDVDGSGAAYVTGQTESADFPTRSPFQQRLGGGPDAFVVKIAADRSIAYATFLGGEGVDVGGGIAVDGAGNAHVTGMTASPDFPTVDSLQPFFGGGSDVFVTRLDDRGTGVTYSTFSGGGAGEAGIDIAVDGSGNAYVVGQTSSSDFPTFNPVQAELQGAQDAFVTKYCLSLVFPETRELGSGAVADSFAVTTAAGCVWIAFSEAPWISLTSPNVVAGGGEVQFAAAPNPTGAPRAGNINIAGKLVTVVQAAATACAYQINPASENFYMVGGVGRINVETTEDCAWTATSNAAWISLSNDKGTGPGVVSYTVETNRTGRQRSGTITVAGQTFVVFDWLREPRP